MSTPSKKILFAAGGTGGHLFPAQALADQLLSENANIELLFAGAKLSDNVYFDKVKFAYCDIASTTPFRGGPFKAFKSVGVLIKGIVQSFQLLSKEKPILVVGFGSFHAFPVICAAVLKRIPLILFESNAIPGKVVRLFSRQAAFTGIFFSEAQHFLKGKSIEVDIPMKSSASSVALSSEEARIHFHLDPHLTTLLVFGGSQGAKAINGTILGMIPLLKKENISFQLLHFTGSDEAAKDVSKLCLSLDIPCHIRKFEPRMDLAWRAADVVICRSGAMTLSELLLHEVPGILIPYPAASDQHQLKNAQVLETIVGGAIHLQEKSLKPEEIAAALLPLLMSDSSKRDEMKAAIKNFKAKQKKANLGKLISERLENK